MSASKTTYLLAVLVTACLAGPAWADDLATSVAAKLRDSGALSGYRVNVKSKSGTVWLEGRVSDERQLAAALGIAEATPGVERVVNRLVIGGDSKPATTGGGFGLPSSMWGLAGVKAPAPQRPAAAKSAQEGPLSTMTGLLFAGGKPAPSNGVQLTQATQPAGRMPGNAAARPMRPQQPMGQRPAMRTVGMGEAMTLPGPGGYDGPLTDGQMVPGSMQYSEGYPADAYAGQGGYAGQSGAGAGPAMGGGMSGGGMGGPMPMAGTGAGMPPVPMRADGPNMPNYAWPSYAASPNYAALQYPTQYSPTAWPYIGPFYPYPQVPLGWRRVSLEWDDGWWWLDFDERHIHSHHR